MGDIDGDGSTDVLVTNDLSGDVSLLRGDGTGDLATARSFVVDGQPVAVVLGDVDGDEKTDVLTANVVGSDGSVAILRNRGAGVLHAVEDVAVAMGPAGVSIGDFDDDALPDVVLAHESGTVLVLAAQAAEGFSVRDTIATGGQLRRVTTADLNGDGRPDVVALSTDASRVDWYENPTWKRRPVAKIDQPIDLAIHDIDRDGVLPVVQHPDVVVFERGQGNERQHGRAAKQEG